MDKLRTNNENLIIIGTDYDEEYYLNLDDDNMRGWSFMGLRPKTEEELREYARETDPEDILGLSREQFNYISQWFNFNKFKDDMEENWYEGHDVQAEREELGETVYLGFGSGQSIFGYFKKHKIKDFMDYNAHFEEKYLKEKEFNALNKIIQKGIKKHGLDMTNKEKAEEKEAIVKILKK